MSGTFDSTIDGGPGNDFSGGTSGNDWILGGDGNDTLAGMTGNDSISGGNDDDYINGADGADTLLGGSGNDLFFDAAGADRYDGGAGSDTIIFAGGGENYTIEYTSVGVAPNNSLSVSVRANSVGAGGPSDVVQNVELLRFDNATVEVDAAGQYDWSGIATFYDGQGRADWQYVTFDAGNYVISDWDVMGLWEWSSIATYYDVQARLDWQAISQEDGALILRGGAGSNTLTGSLGNDTLDGSAGGDFLSAGAGDDSIFGDVGDDTLSGGVGADLMNGGIGSDNFIFGSALSNGDDDMITDFNVSEDSILLEHVFFSAVGVAGAPLEASAFLNGSEAINADHRIIFESLTGALFYDADGSGAGTAVQIATIIIIGDSMTNANFMIV